MQPITLLIADNHVHFRRSLRRLCEVNGDFTVLAETDSGQQTIALTLQLRPHVVLIEWQLPDLSGPEVTRQLIAQQPQTAVILLAFTCHDIQKTLAQQAGAADCLPKDCDEAALFAAVYAAYQGKQPVIA